MARDLKVKIVGDAAGLSRAFGKASGSADRFGSRMAKAGKIAAIGLGGGLAAVGVGLKKSVDAAIEAEKAQTRLDTAFKAANISARERAKGMETVNRVSAQAALDDEDLMDTLGRLTRVTGNAAKAQRDLGIAANIARGRGIELEAATKIVEKAELGQLGALKRIGIEIPKVTEAQDALRESGVKATAEQVKAAKAADDIATRQSAIAALQKQYAGAAEAYGNTSAGAQDRFKVAVENLQETLGQKLLPVVTRVLEWVVKNMPTFERVATQAFQKVGQVIDALRPVFANLIAGTQRLVAFAQAAWPQIQEAAARVVAWYRTNLEPAIRNVIAAVTAIWNRFGGDITRIASTAFNTARQVIQSALNIIRGVVEGVLALIRGDWSKAWSSLKLVVSSALNGIGAIIRGFASVAFRAAVAIGAALIDGIIAGVSGLASRLRDSVTSQIQGAISGIKGVFGIRSPSTVTASQIGQPLGEGVILGWVMGSASLPQKMSESVRNAIEAARQAVATSRGRLGDVWGGVTSDALAAFDAIHSGILTKSEKLLAALQSQRAAADRAGAVTEARAGLATALAGTDGVVDPAAVKSAQKALDDALFAQREYALQQRIIQERRELDARTALQRRHFEQALQRQLEALSKQGAGVGAATKAITKLLNKYDVDFQSAGDALGRAFVAGLKEAILKAAKGAGSLGKVIETAANGINVPGRAGGGPVTAGRAYMVGEHGPELFVPGRTGGIYANAAMGGGPQTIVVQLGDNTIARLVRNAKGKFEQQNGAGSF